MFLNESLLTLFVSVKQNSLMICPLITLTLTDVNYSELRGRKWGTSQEENISDNVNFNEKPVLTPQNIDSICGVVAFPNKDNIIVAANIYRLPKEKINWFDKMDKIHDHFSNTKLELITNGDINCDLLRQPFENHTKHFVCTWESHQLTETVNKPTRVSSD